MTKFGLEDLFNYFFDNEQYSYCVIILIVFSLVAHRALGDVEAMERIMTKTDLVDLSSLPIRSCIQQLGVWATQKNTHHRVTDILFSLGKGITNSQAQRLHALGLSYEALCDLRSSSKDVVEFSEVLFEKGVKSKAVREKLQKLVKP